MKNSALVTLKPRSNRWFRPFGVLATLLVLFFVYIFHIEPNWLQVTQVTVTLPHLSKEFDRYRIVQLSDLHMDSWMTAERLSRVVKLANQQKADLAVITGDYVTMRHSFYGPLLTPVLAELKATDGAVGILGNHDYYWDSPDTMAPFVEKAGVVMLENQVYTIRRGTAQLNIAGVKDIWTNQAQIDRMLAETLAALPSQGTNIMLAHEPEFVELVAATDRFDLQVSGHSHGGQVRIPFLPKILPPMVGNYPTGLYQVRNTFQFTSRGVGTVPPRARFNCRPEIVVLELRANS
jgi:uncharacterized protein